MRKANLKSLLPVLAALAAVRADASVNLVQNGDFELNGGVGQLGGGISYASFWDSPGPATDGTAVPFNFILDTTADDAVHGLTGGFPSVNSATAATNIFVWGPGNGHANGFTGSPTGGKFLGSDGAYATGPVSQLINGLTPGHQYTLSFDWAASQFTDVTGPNYSGWNITFGAQTASTGNVNNDSQGFVPWMHATFDFTATTASQTLSFLATGGPSGLPPFALLDGVSLIDVTLVPEPASLGMLLSGVVAVGVAARRVKRHNNAKR